MDTMLILEIEAFIFFSVLVSLPFAWAFGHALDKSITTVCPSESDESLKARMSTEELISLIPV